MIRLNRALFAVMFVVIVSVSTAPSRACSLPSRPESVLPNQGRTDWLGHICYNSDSLICVHHFYPDQSTDLYVFWYRIDGQIRSFSAPSYNCLRVPMEENSFEVQLAFPDSPERYFVFYNPGQLVHEFKP